MAKPDAVFIYIGTYPSEAGARADYGVVKDLHAAGAIGTYDAAVITKDDAGKVHVSKDEMATRHGAWGGAAVGALIGVPVADHGAAHLAVRPAGRGQVRDGPAVPDHSRGGRVIGHPGEDRGKQSAECRQRQMPVTSARRMNRETVKRYQAGAPQMPDVAESRRGDAVFCPPSRKAALAPAGRRRLGCGAS